MKVEISGLEFTMAGSRYGIVSQRSRRSERIERMSRTRDSIDALDDQQRRDLSLEAARSRVASIPPEHRQMLQNEFLRAEQEARNIMRHGTSPFGRTH